MSYVFFICISVPQRQRVAREAPDTMTSQWMGQQLFDDVKRALNNEMVYRNFVATINSFTQVRMCVFAFPLTCAKKRERVMYVLMLRSQC